jgi:hypothetical protein
MSESITCPNSRHTTHSEKSHAFPNTAVVTCKSCKQRFTLGQARGVAPDLDIAMPVAQPIQQQAIIPAPQGMSLGLKLLFGALGVMVLSCGGCFTVMSIVVSKVPKSTPEEKAKFSQELSMQTRTTRLTKDLLARNLKAPTTAKYDLQTSHVDHKAVLVTGTVTAQNAFSAMITDKVTGVFWWENDKPVVGRLYLADKLLYEDAAVYAKCDEVIKAAKANATEK